MIRKSVSFKRTLYYTIGMLLIFVQYIPSAEAILMLTLTNGSYSQTIYDEDSIDFLKDSVIENALGFTGSIGNYSGTVTLGYYSSADTIPATLYLQSTLTTYSLTDPGDLEIRFFMDNYTAPFLGSVASSTIFGGTLEDGATAKLESYVNGELVSSFTEFGREGTHVTTNDMGNTFTLELIAVVSNPVSVLDGILPKEVKSELNARITVPEPNSLAIMGIGLVGIGFVVAKSSRRKRP